LRTDFQATGATVNIIPTPALGNPKLLMPLGKKAFP